MASAASGSPGCHPANCSRGSRRLSAVLRHVAAGDARVGVLAAAECSAVNRRNTNWGGNIHYGHSKMVSPRTLEELRAAVRDAAGEVRVVGRGHSFSPVCEVRGGTLISLMQLADVLDYVAPGPDGQLGSITFQSGATFSSLAHYLQEQSPPAALRQVPSPSFVTVVGAIATGTHGSGVRNKALASFVTGLELVTADGSLIQYDRETNADEMCGVVVSNGCLGVISQMSLQVVPWFDVQMYRHIVPLEHLLSNWEGIYAAGPGGKLLCDSVSTFVNWQQGWVLIHTRHFTPHYDPSLAADAPNWGEHPFHALAKRWRLVAPRGADLASTALGVGVALRDGNVVASVAPGSMAAGAGIRAGWVLAQMGIGPAPVGAGGQIDGTAMVAVVGGTDAVEALFLGLPPASQQGPYEPGREPKIMLVFEVQGCPADAIAYDAWRGPWYDNLPVWPLDYACAPGPECEYGNQAEYFVPAESAVAAVRAAREVLKHWSFCDQSACPVITEGRGENGYDLEATGMCGVGELRCIRGDDAWISPSGGRDTVSIHLSLSGHPSHLAEIQRRLPDLEAALEPFGARFHWGKLHTSDFYAPRLENLYGDGIRRFRELAGKLDPAGKFRNSWAKELIFPAE